MNKEQAQQLVDILTGQEADATQLLAQVVRDQNKVVAEAVMRTAAEMAKQMAHQHDVAMTRMMQIIEGERVFVHDVLVRQSAFIAAQPQQPRATTTRPLTRSVQVPSPGQKTSSSADGSGAFQEEPAHEQPRPPTDDDDTVIVSDLDPFNFGARSNSANAGFIPQRS